LTAIFTSFYDSCILSFSQLTAFHGARLYRIALMVKLLTLYRYEFCSVSKWEPKNCTCSPTMKEYSYIGIKNIFLA